ncbi:MAG: DEAD/DEAH box helicase [Myxococcales bacterium]|nr:DEAD/DEAH box helicase [Myxococcales bacterium]
MMEETAAALGDETVPATMTTLDSAPDLQADPRTFEEMGLLPDVMQSLTAMGFAEPMEVQRATWRRIMAGKDILVQSRTGSGKTAAFAIPFAQKLIDAREQHVQALCLCPTRELALQVGAECARIGQHSALQVVPVYGGAPMGKQIEGLKAGAQIVAGTPGRVLDHLRRGTLKLDRLKVLVLDEADEMLSMGFYEEISEILKRCPKERQTLLFSATIPEEIERISQRYMRDAEKIELSRDYVGVLEITHAYYMVSGMGRSRDLVRILAVEKPDSAIIFCNTRDETSFVAEHLRREGLDAESISSDLAQKDRERVMGRMKAGNLHYLVATDIAARGIDISDLSHVFNYTFPESSEVYVHRTGRTGRAGKSGVAISLISPRELGNFYYLKLTYKIRPEERMLPTEEQVQSRRDGERIAELQSALGSATPAAEWVSVARRLSLGGGGEATVALLLQRFFAEPAAALPAPAALPSPSPAAPAAGTPQLSTAPVEPAVQPAASRPHAPPTASQREPERTEPRREDRTSRRRDRDGRRDGGHGRDGGRGQGRDRDRSREGGPRAAAPAAAPRAPSSSQATAPPRRPLPGAPIIVPSEGREFWEAWVDGRASDGSAEAAPASAEGTTAPPEGTSRPPEAAAAPAGEARGDRRPRQREELPPGVARLYFALGRRDGVAVEAVEKLVADRGVPVQRLDLHNSHTYLIVAEETVDAAVSALNGLQRGDRTLLCERARR